MPKKAEFRDVQIVREGETIRLPPGMSYKQAHEWLVAREQEETRMVNVEERMEGFPLDCANALQLAVQERYGFKELRTIPQMFAPDQLPLFINAPIDHLGTTREIFMGRFGIPKLEKSSWLQSYADGFDAMGIIGQVRARELPEVKKLVALAREKVKAASIYRGKAIKIQWAAKHDPWMGDSEGFSQPTFMGPKPVGTKLLVNEETFYLIEARIWAMLRQTERCRQLGIPLKRSALCEGPFGTGKTLLAAETAEIAAQNGWTFIYLKDIKWLKEAYQMAVRYSPAVLFAEDLDIAFTGAHAEKHALLNVLDGIDSKGSEVMLILTTNHADRLDTSILRPGRVDAVIPFRAPDSKTAQDLVRMYAGDLLPASVDLTTVGEKLDGRIPAVIREVVEGAKLHALAKSSDGAVVLDEVSLVQSAIGMNHHLEMLDNNLPKQAKTGMEQLGGAMGEEFGKYITLAFAAATGVDVKVPDLPNGYRANLDRYVTSNVRSTEALPKLKAMLEQPK